MSVVHKKGDLGVFEMDAVTTVPMDTLKEKQKPVGTCDVPSCKDSHKALMEIRDGAEEKFSFLKILSDEEDHICRSCKPCYCTKDIPQK